MAHWDLFEAFLVHMVMALLVTIMAHFSVIMLILTLEKNIAYIQI